MMYKNLPKDWEVVRLDEISEIGRGASPRPKGDPRYFGGNIPWIKISDLSKYKVGLFLVRTDDAVTEEGKKKSVYLKDGSLIVSNSGTIGEPAIIKTGKGGCIHDGFIFVKPLKGAEKYYLYYFFDFKKTELQLRAQKGTQGNMNTTLWKSLKIPLPPLPEQRKIAEILSTVDDAIQKVSDAIARTERLKKGLMQRLLTKGIGHKRFKFSKELGCEIPEEWEVVRLVDHINVLKGFAFSSKFFNENGKGIPIIRIRDLGKDKTEAYYFGPYNSIYIVGEGNLLVSMDGEFDVYIWKGPKSLLNQRVCKIWSKNTTKLDNLYLYYALKKPLKLIQAQTSHTTVKHLLDKDIERIKIPLPPLHEQQKIAEILSTVDKKLELERKRKEKLERIKKGLMNDLLTGRKRVKIDKECCDKNE